MRKSPGCCKDGDMGISWEKPSQNHFDGEGPEKEGWAMVMYDAWVLVNVNYCPFCGKRLEDVRREDQD